MKVTVKIVGLAEPFPGFERSNEDPVDFPGNSLGELIKYILSGAGPEMEDLFLSGEGGISPDLVVIVNGIAVTDSNRLNLGLKEGDLVELVSSPG
jgi:sulfur carrier protein ThiS